VSEETRSQFRIITVFIVHRLQPIVNVSGITTPGVATYVGRPHSLTRSLSTPWIALSINGLRNEKGRVMSASALPACSMSADNALKPLAQEFARHESIRQKLTFTLAVTA
jgi:hypothetical protein